MPRAIVLLLALSILVQNTCPYGLAAKTSFAHAGIKSSCPNCTHSEKNTASKGKDVFSKGLPINKAFLLNACPGPFIESFLVMDKCSPLPYKGFNEISPEPLLRPPALS